MLFRVQFVEEPLAEILRVVADALQEIEVFRGDAFQYLPHPCHREFRQSITDPPRIDTLDKVLHQLPALGLSHLFLRLSQRDLDVIHGGIVHYALGVL